MTALDNRAIKHRCMSCLYSLRYAEVFLIKKRDVNIEINVSLPKLK